MACAFLEQPCLTRSGTPAQKKRGVGGPERAAMSAGRTWENFKGSRLRARRSLAM
jgi:hypothetical protein